MFATSDAASCPEGLPDYKEQAGYYQRMPAMTYYRVLDELAHWTRLKSLKFYDLGEPFLNPELPEMIADAVKAGVAEKIELTTNASIMNEALAARLVRSGLQYLRVSVYGATDEAYRSATASRYGASQIVSNVRLLRQVRDSLGSQTPGIYARFLAPTDADATIFREQYEGVADELGVEALHNWGGVDQRLVHIGAPPVAAKRACPQPFYALTVKANGTVTACCLDWSGQLALGDVNLTSLREIWEGPQLRSLLAAQLGGRRQEIPFCRDCEMIAHYPDSLDSLSENDFLERYRQTVTAQ
jgi:MoaA/NifB/PqqE/SkfB family radical SAM enzyme